MANRGQHIAFSILRERKKPTVCQHMKLGEELNKVKQVFISRKANIKVAYYNKSINVIS